MVLISSLTSWHREVPGRSFWERGNSPIYELALQTVRAPLVLQLVTSIVTNLPLFLTSCGPGVPAVDSTRKYGWYFLCSEPPRKFWGNTKKNLAPYLSLIWCLALGAAPTIKCTDSFQANNVELTPLAWILDSLRVIWGLGDILFKTFLWKRSLCPL